MTTLTEITPPASANHHHAGGPSVLGGGCGAGGGDPVGVGGSGVVGSSVGSGTNELGRGRIVSVAIENAVTRAVRRTEDEPGARGDRLPGP